MSEELKSNLANYSFSNAKLNELKKCFIITPIGTSNSEIRREIEGVMNASIIPALTDNGFLPENIKAAHQINISGRIDKQMIKAIFDSELVMPHTDRGKRRRSKITPSSSYFSVKHGTIFQPAIPSAYLLKLSIIDCQPCCCISMG